LEEDADDIARENGAVTLVVRHPQRPQPLGLR